MEHAFKGKDVDGHYNRRAPIGSRFAKSTRLWDKVDMDIETILADVAAAVEPHSGAGKVASYIPALAEVDPRKFGIRSEEHTSELQSLMLISYAVFCMKKK